MIRILEKKKNWEHILILHYAIFPDDEMMDFRDTRIWVASIEGEYVGFASYKDMGNGYCYFTRAGVLPEFRGMGIHNKLIKRRIKAAKGEGFRYATTYTVWDNQHSYDNLQDFGFRVYEPRDGEHYAGIGDNILYWRKEL